MENERDRSHDPGEDLWSCGEAKTKCSKLVDLPVYHKPQEATAVRMHRNLKVCILQVDGDHPVTSPNRLENRLTGLHLEMGLMDEPTETGQIYHRPPRARGLPHDKQTAVKTRTGGWGGGGGLLLFLLLLLLLQVPLPLWPARPQLPLAKLHPWVTTGSSWEEGSELEKAEEVMRRGHDSPSSNSPPPKVLTPRPSRLSSTGTDSRLSEQERDIAPICENSP